MAAQTAAHQPFPDVDEGFVTTRHDDEFLDSIDLIDPVEEIADPLRPMRGLVFGLLLCTPFWMGVYWLLQ